MLQVTSEVHYSGEKPSDAVKLTGELDSKVEKEGVRDIVYSLPMPVYCRTSVNKIVYCNRIFAAMYGMKPNDMNGTCSNAILKPNLDLTLQENCANQDLWPRRDLKSNLKALKTNEPQHYEETGVLPDGLKLTIIKKRPEDNDARIRDIITRHCSAAELKPSTDQGLPLEYSLALASCPAKQRTAMFEELDKCKKKLHYEFTVDTTWTPGTNVTFNCTEKPVQDGHQDENGAFVYKSGETFNNNTTVVYMYPTSLDLLSLTPLGSKSHKVETLNLRHQGIKRTAQFAGLESPTSHSAAPRQDYLDGEGEPVRKEENPLAAYPTTDNTDHVLTSI